MDEHYLLTFFFFVDTEFLKIYIYILGYLGIWGFVFWVDDVDM